MSKEETYRLRRNLTGCFIFDSLPQDNGKKKPTDITDCNEATLRKWLESAPKTRGVDHVEWLKSVEDILNECWERLRGSLEEKELELIPNRIMGIDVGASKSKEAWIDEIVNFAGLIKFVALFFGICSKDSEYEKYTNGESINDD